MSFSRAYLLSRPIATRVCAGQTRTFAASSVAQASFPFRSGPAPPRLPEEDQKVFEELQRQSTGAFSTPRSQRFEDTPEPTELNQSPDASASEVDEAKNAIAQRLAKLRGSTPPGKGPENALSKKIDIEDDAETVHPNLRRGAQPEFEGDVNPKTGEVGGPKNEPLRWGAEGEWTYNGRTTDF